MKRNDLYMLTIGKYGTTAQQLKLLEEMSELSKEIIKGLLDEVNRGNLIDEVADVEIVLEQLKLMHGIGEDVKRRKKWKKKRLEKRL